MKKKILPFLTILLIINLFFIDKIIAQEKVESKMISVPGVFHLLSPNNGLVWIKRVPLILRWEVSQGAKNYRVTIFKNEAGTEVLNTLDADTARMVQLSKDAYSGKQIWWTVTASDKNSAGENKKEAGEIWSLSFYSWSDTATPVIPKMKVPVTLSRPTKVSFALDGYLRKRIDRSIQRYFLETPESSPAMLQILRDRDRLPPRNLMPWSGEFAGKYLTGAQLVWRLTHDPALKQTIDTFVRDMIKCQDVDGYLGPFPKDMHLTAKNTWDVWGHYHCMLGLMLYYEDTQYKPALKACERIGDLLFETFGHGGPSLTNDSLGGQMNMAVCHGLLLLYKKTGVSRYRDLANYIVNEAWNEPRAGKYLNSVLDGKSIIEFPLHRWEAIHDWQALGELYGLTGDAKYQTAMEKIWHYGVDGDRHNTGGITAGEGFTGSPYHPGAIETCCTVAWTAFSADLLQITGNSKIADEIEWSTFNSALGAIPYSGRTCAYNTPMDGTRLFGVELPWQSPMAGPDLNCCAVNAYRPLGIIAQWALMQSGDGPVVNFYGPGKMTMQLPSDNQMSITEETEYPAEGLVKLALTLTHPETFTLKLRIPFWSTNTGIRINGKTIAEKAGAGTYLAIERAWKSGDKIELALDFKLRLWYGDKECKGKVSVFRGPILCTYDARFNDFDPMQIPELDASSIVFERKKFNGPIEPWIYGVLKDKDGAKINVCDFSSAGQTGNQYRSWLLLAKGITSK